jgi:lipoate-protein ligase A
VETKEGSLESLLGDLDWSPEVPTIRECLPLERGLVLGRSQPLSDARHPEAIVRRVSGGGAVWVEPGALSWVDVWVPSDDQLHEQDLRVAFSWLGQAWFLTLRGLLGLEGSNRLGIHSGGLAGGPWAKRVCFAGRGPGEVFLEGRKVVGIAARRTKRGTRFQCAAICHWSPAKMLEEVNLLPGWSKPEAVGYLKTVAAGISLEASVVSQSFVSLLEKSF